MELTLDQALQKGVEAHKAGKAQEADKYYTAILKANPKHPDANHNMGVLAVGVGKVEAALPFFKTALEVNQTIGQYWLSYINALIKLDRMDEAKSVLNKAKSNGAKGDGFDQLDTRLGSSTSKNSNVQNPSQKQIQSLINLYTQGQYQEALNKASRMLIEFPNSFMLYNVTGAANQGMGKQIEAVESYKKAVYLNPDYAETYNNMGNTLKDQGKLDEAIEVLNKALNLKPDFSDAYYNMGNVFKEKGKLEEAIDAFNKALYIKPDFSDAYYNMGNALKDHSKLEEAGEAYNKAITIKPDFAEAHLNLSLIKKYSPDDKHFLQVKGLYGEKGLSKDVRCKLSFALAKMYEDIGKLDKSFASLTKGNTLRKELLNYSINEDKHLFTKLKNTQPYLLKNSLDIKEHSIEPTPVFILGMPRSGTTLVEQIISSHSEVLGAGELSHTFQLGLNLAANPNCINATAISEFRKKYLSELSKLSDGKPFVTDKMPQNFRFIPLICAAFPEAKIVHVQRNAAATCWSNFKQYFASNSLGYCYSLKDVVSYYELYSDLMKLWQSHYGDRIYNLNYEKLTTDQENQTRKLIEHLGLNWEQACLSPQKNKRSVGTASQQQVRQKVYQGSSEGWRKYIPYLNGAFDSLPSS